MGLSMKSGVAATEVIRADEVYSLQEFLHRTRMRQWAYHSAIRRGLRVIRTAGRVFVRGADWHEYLGSVSQDQVATGRPARNRESVGA